jgi:hypothetical protein
MHGGGEMTADATWSTWPTILFAGVAVPASLLHRLVVLLLARLTRKA